MFTRYWKDVGNEHQCVKLDSWQWLFRLPQDPGSIPAPDTYEFERSKYQTCGVSSGNSSLPPPTHKQQKTRLKLKFLGTKKEAGNVSFPLRTLVPTQTAEDDALLEDDVPFEDDALDEDAAVTLSSLLELGGNTLNS